MYTDLHNRHVYFCRTDFAMKRGHTASAITSMNAVKIIGVGRFRILGGGGGGFLTL